MKIRKVNKEDINDLIKLMQRADNRNKNWAEARTKSYINNKKKLILVAEDEGNLVGFVGIKKYEDNEARKFVNLNNFIWITWIAVLPEYRRKGIGSELLKVADEYVKIFNKLGTILDCRQKVIGFYKINGYNISGEYIDKEIPRYVMVKEMK